jgi:mRNA interferase HigB
MACMHVVSRKMLKDFYRRNRRSDAGAAKEKMDAWYHEAKGAKWRTPADIKVKFGSASILKNHRVVFNICGNDYRIVTKISYAKERTKGVVYIRFVGTHEEYDAIDAQEYEHVPGSSHQD